MRFAVIADPHIGRSIPLAIAEHRRKAFCVAFTRAVDECISRGIDYVFITGDMFERRTLRPYLVQFAHDELYRLVKETHEKHGIESKILIVRGNHDGRPQSDTLDYIKHPLAEYLYVFGDSPEEVTFKDDRLHVVGLNYYDQIDKAFDYYVVPAFEGAEGLRVFIVHHFVQGLNAVPPYSSSLTFDKLAEVNPDFVFTGHYHRRCEPKKLPNGGWIVTPGSLEMYDFAESPDKGFYIVEVGEESPRFEWVPIEPMHLMKQVRIKANHTRPPSWYNERIMEEVNGFSNELTLVGKEGYLRIHVTGRLSQGFPTDVNSRALEEIVQREPLLLWVDLDTMNLGLPPMTARPEKNSKDVSEFFSSFGDLSEDIRDMHSRVKDALENEASEQTGLLKPSSRTPYILDWVKRFESHRFKEDTG